MDLSKNYLNIYDYYRAVCRAQIILISICTRMVCFFSYKYYINTIVKNIINWLLSRICSMEWIYLLGSYCESASARNRKPHSHQYTYIWNLWLIFDGRAATAHALTLKHFKHQPISCGIVWHIFFKFLKIFIIVSKLYKCFNSLI